MNGEQQPHTVAHVLGEMTWLLSQSAAHKHMPISTLEQRVMPAILLQQFRLFYHNAQPVGYAVWAFVSDEVDAALTAAVQQGKPFLLGLEQWRSGSHAWLIELIAPTATTENKLVQVLQQQLETTAFKDKTLKYFQPRAFDAQIQTNEIGHA